MEEVMKMPRYVFSSIAMLSLLVGCSNGCSEAPQLADLKVFGSRAHIGQACDAACETTIMEAAEARDWRLVDHRIANGRIEYLEYTAKKDLTEETLVKTYLVSLPAIRRKFGEEFPVSRYPAVDATGRLGGKKIWERIQTNGDGQLPNASSREHFFRPREDVVAGFGRFGEKDAKLVLTLALVDPKALEKE